VRSICNPQMVLEGFPVEIFRNDLLTWWHASKRRFPWRETTDPYKVLIAEILLHRTKAEQVIPLYGKFLRHFPDVKTIAASTPPDIQLLFYSAGLHWRWKYLHLMASEILTRFNGQIPHSYDDLIDLPGVSNYIATAVRCFSLEQQEAVLDTNTVRLASRLLDVPAKDSSRRSQLFRSILQLLLDPQNPREFNFAMLDFAAIVCRAKSPRHEKCSFRYYCRSYQGAVVR